MCLGQWRYTFAFEKLSGCRFFLEEYLKFIYALIGACRLINQSLHVVLTALMNGRRKIVRTHLQVKNFFLFKIFKPDQGYKSEH